MRFPFFALALLCALPAQAQRLGPEFHLDVPVVGPAGGRQDSPAVAWVGSGFFVAWSDTRDDRSADLWFRRFDDTGKPLSALSAPLLRGAGEQVRPSLSFGAGQVLVTWLDASSCDSEVMAQVFSLAGAPVGTALRLSTGACTRERPSVAYDAVSARWLVAWAGDGAGHRVRGALIAADGTLAVAAFDLTTSPATTRAVWASEVPTGFLVSWSDDRLLPGTPQVWLATVSSAGAVGAAALVGASPTAQPSACLTAFGAGALVAWREGNTVRAQEVTSAAVAVGAPMVVVTAPVTVNEVACAPGPLGSAVLSWVDSRAGGSSPGVFFTTISPGGVVTPEVSALPKVGYFERDSPRVAASGTAAFVVARGPWGFVTGSDVLGRLLPLAGAADAGLVLIGTAGTALSHVNCAFGGDRYLAVWRDDGQSAAGSDTFGQFLESSTGRPLLDGGVRVTTGSANLVSYPSVAASDAGFFVGWGDDGSGGQLVGKTVSPAGALGSRLVLSDTSSYVNTHVSRWVGGSFATTFLKSGTLRARRTLATGATLQAETLLLNTTGVPNEQLDAAPLDDVLLSVFTTRDGGLDVWGALLADDGGVFLVPVTSAVGDEIDPVVGAGSGSFLVAWSQLGAVFATRVSKQGALLDSPPLALGAGVTPTVAWTGAEFVIGWRSGDDVVAVRVSEQGGVLDLQPLVVGGSPEVDRAPHAASGPAEALLTWESFDPSWGSFRLLGRFLRSADPDAGVSQPDGGALDAGAPDGGAEEEADAGGQAIARRLAVGCGCGEGSGSSPLFPLLLVLALFAAVTPSRR